MTAGPAQTANHVQQLLVEQGSQVVRGEETIGLILSSSLTAPLPCLSSDDHYVFRGWEEAG